jgi:transposase-like protein
MVALISLCSNKYETGVSTVQIREILRSFGDRPASASTPKPRRKWTRLTPEQRQDVVDRYRAGEHTTTIAKSFDVAKSTIIKVLRDNDVPMRRQAMTPEQVTEGVQLYVDEELSLSHVAERLGVVQETMRLALLDVGVTLRPKTGGETASHQLKALLGT